MARLLPREDGVMRWAQPVLLVLLFVLPWIVSVGRRARLSRLVIVLRAAAFAAIVLAAAGTAVRAGHGSASVVFVVDRSASVTPRQQTAALQRASAHSQRMATGDAAAVVVFGGDAAIEQPLGTRPLSAEAASAIMTGATSIERAIRIARNILPSDGSRHIVVMSDGRQTAGDAAAEARAAAASGIAVHTVALQRDARTLSARVTEVRAPASARIGEPFDLAVRAEGPAGTSGTVEIRRGDAQIGVHPVTFDASNAATVVVQDRLELPGAATYTGGLRTASGESDAEAGAVVIATTIPTVLHVTGSGAALHRAVDGTSYRIQRVQPDAVPNSATTLASFAAVLLDDVAGGEINDRQSQALVKYVADGGGLLLRGSDRSLEPASYTQSPIGAVLPLDLRRRSGNRPPDVAVAVVFDKSGSMDDSVGDVTKIELARRAVVAVQEVLQPGDALGVIAFDAQPSVVAPLAPGYDAENLRSRLRQIAANGPTAIAPAVQMAYEWLRASRASGKQILLLSDGRSNADDAARVLALTPAPDISLSVVATGSDVDRAFFRELAERGRGRLFFPDDVRRLPEILAREAARASGGWRVRERFTATAPVSHPVLAGIDRTRMPMLDGYIAAAARPGAETPVASHLGDPLLATWRHGLGRVAVFTGDISPSFERWPEYGRLWRQTIRWIGGGDESSALTATVDMRSRAGALVVDAIDGNGAFLNHLSGEASIATPAGGRDRIELRPSSPGRYEAVFDAAEPGAYVAAVSLRDRSGREMTLRRGIYWIPPGESAAAADTETLTEIARSGGGRVLREEDNPFDFERQSAFVDISGALTMLALVLFIVDTAIRRGVSIAALRRLRHAADPRETSAA